MSDQSQSPTPRPDWHSGGRKPLGLPFKRRVGDAPPQATQPAYRPGVHTHHTQTVFNELVAQVTTGRQECLSEPIALDGSPL